jgi:hypothetical protein
MEKIKLGDSTPYWSYYHSCGRKNPRNWRTFSSWTFKNHFCGQSRYSLFEQISDQNFKEKLKVNKSTSELSTPRINHSTNLIRTKILVCGGATDTGLASWEPEELELEELLIVDKN